jgi:hypothetical protein
LDNIQVIEDLDGGDPGPGRAPVVRAISVALVFAALVGYAALSSPALRGPYATPDPLTALAAPARYIRAPTDTIDNAAKVFPARCIVPGEVFVTTIFLNGQSVYIGGQPVFVNGQPATEVIVSPNGRQVVSAPLTRSVTTACLASDPPVPFDRFAR